MSDERDVDSTRPAVSSGTSPAAGPVVGIAGAGRMGRGIAVASALAGIQSRLIELKHRTSTERLALQRDALGEVQGTIEMLADIGLVEPANIEAISSKTLFADVSALAECDFIFEAVPETLEAKTTAFQTICEHVTNDTIIASTTSTILSLSLIHI